MLNKYVILVTLVVNSLSDNHDNEVEAVVSNVLKYGNVWASVGDSSENYVLQVY